MTGLRAAGRGRRPFRIAADGTVTYFDAPSRKPDPDRAREELARLFREREAE